MLSSLHPSLWLLLWGLLLVVTQHLRGATLFMATLALLVLAAFLDTRGMAGLMRRGRVLLLALLLVFAMATPGRLLWPAWPMISPSFEGLELSFTHGLRLLAVLSMVCLLLKGLGLDRLVTALYGLCAPLSCLGFDRARAALRLALVLRYCALSEPSRHWQSWLECSPQAQSDEPPVVVSAQPMRKGDYLVLALTGIALAIMAWAEWLP